MWLKRHDKKLTNAIFSISDKINNVTEINYETHILGNILIFRAAILKETEGDTEANINTLQTNMPVQIQMLIACDTSIS